MSDPQRIALYGGTFDPVHEGHLAIALAAVEQARLDRVLFLPAEISPHKQDREPTSGEHRASMLRLALEDQSWGEVSEWELQQEGPSYSWKTAEYYDSTLRTENEATELFWIMGEDQWEALPRWSRPERLAELLHFLVFTRNGERPAARKGWKMSPMQGTHPASSTAIRKALRLGKPPLHLPDAVQHYVAEHFLYEDALGE